MRPITLAELHGQERCSVEEVVSVGIMLARQLLTSDVHLGHADPTLLLLGSDGVRVLDAQRKALGRRGQVPQTRAAAWLSPELVQGKPLDVRTSVFSTAAMVVGLLVGRSPWQRENVFETLRAIMRGEWSRPLAELRRDVPLELMQLLASATASEPEQRPATLRLLSTHLAPFAPEGHDITWAKLVKRLLTDQSPTTVPHGDEARLVHADELEEQALDLEARWVRLEVHVARALGAERVTLQQTLSALSVELGPERVAQYSRAAIDACPMVVGGRCPGQWDALEPVEGVRRTCHECGTTVVHVLDVQRAQDVVYEGGTVAIDVAAERTTNDLDVPDDVLMRT